MTTGDTRFLIMMAASVAVYLLAIRIALRTRDEPAPWSLTALVATVVVVGGMVYGRVAAQAGLDWWLYLFPPMIAWLAVPPIAFHMRGAEAASYLLLASLASPLVHVAFSFLLGWHEYIPAWRLPSLLDLVK
jgi:hypothetical protein